jgi:hypothetical protein
MPCRSLVLAGLIALAAATPARADMIIGSLPGDNSVSLTPGVGDSYAEGFTMTSSFQLTSATLRLNVPSGKTPTFFLMSSDASGKPSTTLFTFTNPTFGSGTQNYAFTPPSPFTLTAGTTYWLAWLGTAATGNTEWFGNGTPTGTGATSAGALRNNGSFPPTTASIFMLSYQIDGTPLAVGVPAPPTLLLGLVGVRVAGVARLRRFW